MSMSDDISVLADMTQENSASILAQQMVIHILVGAMKSVLGDEFNQFANNAILYAEKMVEEDPDSELMAKVKEKIDNILSDD